MSDIISCEFNIDAGCVELLFADGSTISMDRTKMRSLATTSTALSYIGLSTTAAGIR